MRKLFFDIHLSGHHSEYVSHLVEYISGNKDKNSYFFVVNPEFSVKFPTIAHKAKQAPAITWIEITPGEYEKCLTGGMVRKSFSGYRLMHRYAKQYSAEHVCLLYFNTFQLACAFYRPTYKISGILFLQFYRMGKNTWKEKLRYYRKYFTTKFYALSPAIKGIFILNDQKTADYLNREFNSHIFKMIPDPIPELRPLENFDIYNYYNFEKSRRIFLHLGTLGDRKGTFEVIDAAQFIPEEAQQGIAILLVGKAENTTTTQTILHKIKENETGSGVRVVWDNQFVTTGMMKSLFDQSAAVLMPYKNTEASSGILGHAAAANKKVIATGKGLIKEIIEENNLGFLIDQVTPNELASKMVDFLSMEPGLRNPVKFILEHSPAKFSEIIISN